MKVVDDANERKRFPSIDALRAAHEEMLQKSRVSGETPEFLDEVREFVSKGTALGALLFDSDDRWDAQSKLDYWTNILYRYDLVEQEADLEVFNAELAPDLDPKNCPYVGLDAFNEHQYNLFFGRQTIIESFLNHLKTRRMLAVLGESGSGKSSLVFAGLLPELKKGALEGSDDWHYLSRIVPGSDPIRSLVVCLQMGTDHDDDKWIEDSLTQLREDPEYLLKYVKSTWNQPVVMVVDQFEEVFTLCDNDQDQQAFVDNLLYLVSAPGENHRLILTMRTDFETKIVTVKNLQTPFESATVHVPPMNANELRQAIEKPADLVGLVFDKGLVDRLVDDVLGEPASLPLLQFSLYKLWQYKDRNRVTWNAYNKLGGGVNALQNSAEAFYSSLSKELQDAVEQILIHLTRIDERMEVYSKRIRRVSLFDEITLASDRVDNALQMLVQERLVRLTHGTNPEDDQVEVTHETLIRNWQRFISWIEDERVKLRQRQRLAEATERWLDEGRDNSFLWRGVMLDQALLFEDVTELEAKFIKRSVDAQEASKQHELSQAQKLRRLTIMLAIALVLALTAASIAMIFWNEANQKAESSAKLAIENQAIAETSQSASTEAIELRMIAEVAKSAADAASTEALFLKETAVHNEHVAKINAQEADTQKEKAEEQSNLASSRQFATQSMGYLETQLELSSLLGIMAFKQADTVEAKNALLSIIQQAIDHELQEYGRPIPPQSHDIEEVALSPKGRFLAWSTTNGSVVIWDYEEQNVRRRFTVHDEPVKGLAFSPDGKKLATGDTAGQLYIWDIATGKGTKKSDVGSIYSLSFSPDGKRLAVAVGTQISLWDLNNFTKIDQLFHGADVYSVSWSPDGDLLASGGGDNLVIIWDPNSGEPILKFPDHEDSVYSVAWSPDSKVLASGGVDSSIMLWDIEAGKRVNDPIEVHGNNAVRGLAFGPNGNYLASGGGDRNINILDVNTLKTIARLEGYYIYGVTSVAIESIEGDILLVSGSFDNSVGLHKITPQQPLHEELFVVIGKVLDLVYKNNDDVLVFSKLNEEAILQRFDPNPNEIFTTPSIGVTTVAISPDGEQFAFSDSTGSIYLYDLESRERTHTINNSTDIVSSLVFNNSGEILISGHCVNIDTEADPLRCLETEIRRWNTTDGSSIGSPLRIESDFIDALAISNDKGLIATGARDNSIALWNLENQEFRALPYSQEWGGVTGLAFNPDGDMLASSGDNGLLHLWDMETLQTFGKPIASPKGVVSSMYFSSNGDYLITGSEDGTISKWDVSPDSWIERVCKSAERNFTQSEWKLFFPGETYEITCDGFPPGD